MEEFHAVTDYLVKLVVERGAELVVFCVMVLIWRWFLVHKLGKRITAMQKELDAVKALQPRVGPTQIILQRGATYNDFRGANGEWHLRADGPFEFIAPEPVPVRFHFSVSEPKVTVTRKDESKGDADETDA